MTASNWVLHKARKNSRGTYGTTAGEVITACGATANRYSITPLWIQVTCERCLSKFPKE